MEEAPNRVKCLETAKWFLNGEKHAKAEEDSLAQAIYDAVYRWFEKEFNKVPGR